MKMRDSVFETTRKRLINKDKWTKDRKEVTEKERMEEKVKKKRKEKRRNRNKMRRSDRKESTAHLNILECI